MKKVIQEKIVKIIQPEIIKYYCDKPGCGHELNFFHRKSMWWRRINGKSVQLHFCKEEHCEDALNTLNETENHAPIEALEGTIGD